MIARALACRPQLIIADEPVSMLDVSLRAGILTLLGRPSRETGVSLLYITHDLLSARLVTDELLVMSHGRIVEQGGTKRRAAAPARRVHAKAARRDSQPVRRRAPLAGRLDSVERRTVARRRA